MLWRPLYLLAQAWGGDRSIGSMLRKYSGRGAFDRFLRDYRPPEWDPRADD